MTATKVMLVDDHSIVRDGIRLLLEQADGLDIIDEANDGEEALDKLKITATNAPTDRRPGSRPPCLI